MGFSLEGKVRFHSIRRQVVLLENAKGFRTTEHSHGMIRHDAADLTVPYSTQNNLESVTIAYREGQGKAIRLSKKDGRDRSLVGDLFYTDHRVKLFHCAPTQRFDMHVVMSCDDPMLLSRIPTQWFAPADTVITEVDVPAGMRLYHDQPANSRIRIAMDSLVVGNRMRYVFTAIDPDPESRLDEPVDGRLLPANRLGAIRVLVTHGSTINDPQRHFNDWMVRLSSPVMGLGTETAAIAAQIRSQHQSDQERMRATFDLVKNKVSYIAIEDGLNAFRPRPAEDTWNALKGDCKDMALLICALLRELGIDSHLAVSSTLTHGADVDFPSLSSGNHMICVSRLGIEWYFLDATESTCPFGWPSQHIQGRHVLRFSPNGPETLKVHTVPSERNRMLIDFDAMVIGTELQGWIRITAHGSSARRAADGNAKEIESGLVSRIKSLGRNWRVDSLSYTLGEDSLVALAHVSAPGNVTTTGSKRYISQKGLPFPHGWPTVIGAGYELPLFEAARREVTVTLRSQTALRVAKAEPIAANSGSLSFTWAMTNLSNGAIELRYTYEDGAAMHTSETAADYNTVNAVVRNTLNSTLIDEAP